MSEYEYHKWYDVGTEAADWALLQVFKTNLESIPHDPIPLHEFPPKGSMVMALYPHELPPPPEPEVKIEYFVKYSRETHPVECQEIVDKHNFYKWVELDGDFFIAIPPLADIPEPGESKDHNPWLEPGSDEAKALLNKPAELSIIQPNCGRFTVGTGSYGADGKCRCHICGEVIGEVEKVRRQTHYVPEGGE